MNSPGDGTRGEVAAEGVRRAVRDGVDPTNKAKLQEYINEEIRWLRTKVGTLRERYAFDPSSADDVMQERCSTSCVLRDGGRKSWTVLVLRRSKNQTQ